MIYQFCQVHGIQRIWARTPVLPCLKHSFKGSPYCELKEGAKVPQKKVPGPNLSLLTPPPHDPFFDPWLLSILAVVGRPWYQASRQLPPPGRKHRRSWRAGLYFSSTYLYAGTSLQQGGLDLPAVNQLYIPLMFSFMKSNSSVPWRTYIFILTNTLKYFSVAPTIITTRNLFRFTWKFISELLEGEGCLNSR